MEVQSVKTVIEALNRANVRYLVSGGLAVVAHGYARFTADVDIVLDFESGKVKAAVEALASLGYRPHAPVAFEEFADPVKRAQWVREKDLKVFSLYSKAHSMTDVDLFVDPPVDFRAAYARCARMDLGGVEATFVGYEDLRRMKALAGRPQDLDDIEQLEAIRGPEGG